MASIIARRTMGAGAAALAALGMALAPALTATAAGPVWLRTMRAAHPSADLRQPALATYRNHAYILTAGAGPGNSTSPGVYLTTDESGRWTTTRVSARGPVYLVQHYQTALAIDPSTKRLYAAWVYPGAPGQETLGVWTRDASGAWSGPTDIASTGGAFNGPPSLVAGDGKAYLAYPLDQSTDAAPCHQQRADALVATYNGTNWSSPQNVTNCVAGLGEGQGFGDPKLALDGGHLYLATYTGDAHDIWYADTAGGSWSPPIRVPDGRGKGSLGGSYSIAASNGVAYIAYPVVAHPYHDGYEDIYMATHAPGAAFTVSRVTSDGDNCAKYAPALVARAGRLGLAYLFGNWANGECASTDHDPGAKMGAHLLTGTPGHWVEAPLGLGTAQVCEAPAVSSDGDIFRLAAGCHRGEGLDDYYYKAEFLDVVGPTARLRAPAMATAPSVALSWSAQDPTPGSGVSSYDLQVKRDGGAWQDLTPATTRSTSYVYTRAAGGHTYTYTFRLRARDGVNNCGGWTTATTRVS